MRSRERRTQHASTTPLNATRRTRRRRKRPHQVQVLSRRSNIRDKCLNDENPLCRAPVRRRGGGHPRAAIARRPAGRRERWRSAAPVVAARSSRLRG
eukprot:5904103-Prymnesium_polylepis.1